MCTFKISVYSDKNRIIILENRKRMLENLYRKEMLKVVYWDKNRTIILENKRECKIKSIYRKGILKVGVVASLPIVSYYLWNHVDTGKIYAEYVKVLVTK